MMSAATATSAARNSAKEPLLHRRQRMLLLPFRALDRSSCRTRPVEGHALPLLLLVRLPLLLVDVTTAERCKAKR
jgi:hypothetical protein